MSAYILRRLLLIIPTFFGIMCLNFAIIQLAPGGPIEQVIAEIKGYGADPTARIPGTSESDFQTDALETIEHQTNSLSSSEALRYPGARGIDPEYIRELERQFGFDKPLHERFVIMMGNYLRFDFGESFFRNINVVDLVLEKLPVSISLGLWTTLLIYLISIPLGIRKATRDGSRFDVWTSVVVVIGNAIPGFLFAVLLLIFFGGGQFLDWFPRRGLTSDDWHTLSWGGKILDYFWHLALPITAMVIGGFAGLTLLTKNSFVDEIGKQYVMTARSKGLTEPQILYGHIFRNAMLIIISGFPGLFIGIIFTGSLLIEIIFSLDGLGLLGYEAILTRDYPVVFGTLYVFTFLGLIMNLIGDLTYVLVDPRIDFETQGG